MVCGCRDLSQAVIVPPSCGSTVCSLHSMTGYYRKSSRNVSGLSLWLNYLHPWSSDCHHAVEDFKALMCCTPISSTPNFTPIFESCECSWRILVVESKVVVRKHGWHGLEQSKAWWIGKQTIIVVILLLSSALFVIFLYEMSKTFETLSITVSPRCNV